MVKAVSTIIVGKKVFNPGQAVTGLSPIDMRWMKKAGYIMDEMSDGGLKTEVEIRAMTRKDDVIMYAESIGLHNLTTNYKLDELKAAVLKFHNKNSSVEATGSRQRCEDGHEL